MTPNFASLRMGSGVVGTGRGGPLRALLMAGCAVAVMGATPALAGHGPTLPSGGTFRAGSGKITGADAGLTINQGSQRAIIDWNSFSIGRGGNVTFNNGKGATLNRVTGGNLSSILGTLKATGTLYLINPEGVVIGSSGVVVTGGSFTASTLDIADKAFMAGGTLLFKGDSAAAVKNLGRISASGGDVLLIARDVSNGGAIKAPNGTVGLAAGQQVLLKDGAADERVYVQVGGGNVTNTGTIDAAQAELKAAGGNVYALAGNGGGAIRATGTTIRDGHVWLSANGDIGGGTARAGVVKIAGTVGATDADGTGGTIIATGRRVAVKSGATVDASGQTGAGGTILLGGDRQGGKDAATKLVAPTVATAGRTTVATGATLKADGAGSGRGGNIVVWSKGLTGFSGHISAQGGAAGGDGGVAEVSSHRLLDFHGTVTMTAAHGAAGSLLLDPEDVTISSGADSNASQSGGVFTPTGDSSVINTTTLQNALLTADVTITTGSTGSQAGNITIANNVSWSSSHGLTLSAYRTIAFNAGVSVNATGGGTITLRADSAGTGTGTVTFAGAASASSSGGVVNIYYNPSAYTSPTNFGGNVTGTLNAYMLVNTAQNLQDLATNLSGTYALGRDIDAGGTRTWNGGAGFTPIDNFTGSLDGQGHTVTGLTINRPTTLQVGLFGGTVANNGPKISNLGLVDVNITGQGRVGGLIGRANGGGSLDNVYVTGSITGYGDFVGGLIGQDDQQNVSNAWTDVSITVPQGYSGTGVGGLVGWQRLGTLTNVHASGNVYAPDMSRVGGLLGTDGFIGFGQGATVSNAYATGNVTGNDAVGGLIGIAEAGSIANTYATGSVTGVTSVGGLVGINANPITLSWASGAVTRSSGSAASVGALVGTNGDSAQAGTIATSYWDSYTAPGLSAAGATVGASTASAAAVTSDPTQSGAANYAFKASAYAAFDFTADWWTNGDATRPMGRWEYSTTITNVHQLQLMSLDLTADYTLARDIAMPTLTQSGMWSSAGFSPVGSGLSPFSGTFDGQHHVIDGLTINRPSTDQVGLFGVLQTTASVRDLGIADANVTGSTGVGILAGLNNGLISGSYTTGSVTGAVSTGGMVGGISANGAISSSYSAAAVRGTGAQTGGLAGFVLVNGSITDSYATGSVTGSTSVGGLAGDVETAVGIARSYSSGAVTGTAGVGGLFGVVAVGTPLTDVYWDIGTSGTAVGIGVNSSASTATGLTTAQARLQASYAGFDFTNTWYIVPGSTRPFLRSEYSTTIHNAHQLQLVNLALGASYTLANDIDLTSLTTDASDVWAGGGFSALGTFTGNLSGANHTIDGLTLTASTAGLGLFTRTNGGSLANITLTNVSIAGTSDVGALVGSASGTTISNVTVSGSVSGTGQLGGVVGSATGGTISFAGMSGTVSGTTDSIGGVVGFTSAAINDSWSEAAVSSTGVSSHGLYVGGLAGQSTGTITRSWASGTVTGWTDLGGLVGLASGDISLSTASGAVTGGGSVVGGLVGNLFGASLTNSYATGAVTGFQEVGGLVGLIQIVGVSITDSYASGRVRSTSGSAYTAGLVGLFSVSFAASGDFWDTTSTGQSFGAVTSGVGVTPPGFTGIDSVQARTASTFTGAGWDLTNTWYMVDGSTRPMLRSEASAVVRNGHQLQLIDVDPGLGYTLAHHIDLGSALADASELWDSGGFSPIANFGGTFDGAGHTISGLTINRPSASSVGLFSATNGGAYLHDVTLSNVSITGDTLVGALVGDDGGTKISRIVVTGSINGNSAVGGVAGSISAGGVLEQAKADVLITAGGTDVGGLVGSSNGTVRQSYALGGILLSAGGSGQAAGGLIGSNSGTVTDAYAQVALLGTVNGSGSAVGGLIGRNTGSVTDTYSIGAVVVTGTGALGGLIGNNGGTVTASFFDTETSGLGVGTGSGSAAGITGKTTAQLMTKSTFTGAGWDFTTPVWGIVGGTTLPYFAWEHAGSVQVVTGTAYGDAAGNTLAVANRVTALSNGTLLGSGFAGANGYYYILADGSPIGAGTTFTYLNPALGNTALGNAVHLTAAGGNTIGLGVYAGAVTVTSDGPAVTTSALAAGRPSGIDSQLLYSVSGTTVVLAPDADLDIEAGTRAITIDDGVTLSGTGVLTMNSTATATQTGAITTPSLVLLGLNGKWQFGDLSGGNSINSIGTLAADTGSIIVGSKTALVVGTVDGTAGITLNGGLAFVGGNTSVTQTAAINAVGLALEGGAYTLTGGSNHISNFTADGATFDVAVASDISVDTVAAAGQTYHGLILAGATNRLTAAGVLDVQLTGGDVMTLVAGGKLTLAGGDYARILDTNVAVGAGGGRTTLTITAKGTISIAKASGASATIDGTATAPLDLLLFADTDTDGQGGIGILNTDINTHGGNVALVGGPVVSDLTSAGSAHSIFAGTTDTAILIGNASLIDAGGGDIVIHGQASENIATTSYGIWISDAGIKTSGNGFIDVIGSTTGNAAGIVTAVSIDLASLTVASGDLTIFGTAANGAGTTTGVLLHDASLTAGSGDDIILTGIANSAGNAIGLKIYSDNGSQIKSVGSNIGLAGSSSTANQGVILGNGGGSETTTIGGAGETGDIRIFANGATLDNGRAVAITTQGDVTIAPFTTGQAVELGTVSAAGALNIDARALNAITADTLIVGTTGSPATGDIALAGAIAPNVTTLALETTGSVTQSGAGGLTVANLSVEADGAVSLAGANAVTTFAVDTTGAVTFKATGGLTIGTVNGVTGVTGTTIGLTSGAGSRMIVSKAILGTNVTLTADRLTLNSTVTGSGIVTFAPLTAGWDVDLGSTTDVAATTLEISSAELNRVSAATLVVDPAVAGDISITSAIAPAHAATLVLDASGTITQGASATITVSNLAVNAGGAITLNAANRIGTLAADGGGTVGITTAGNIRIGTVAGVAGIDATGAVKIVSGGSLTLASAVSSQAAGTAVTLSADTAFVNTAGAAGIATPNGRWLVYSAASAGDTFGGLNSNHTAIWGHTLADGAIGQPGNRYVFAQHPTITITANDQTKTYGQDVTGTLAGGGYSVSGLSSGVAGAYLGDSMGGALSTGPTIASSGAGAGANVGTYTITAGGAVSANGYAITYADGTLTVNKASLTVTANSPTTTYGQTATLGVSYSGFVNGDGAGSLGGHIVITGAGTNVGTYTLTASGLTSGNYAITYVSGTETIEKASLTVTANSPTITYGQTATLGVSYGGFVNGDTAGSLGGHVVVRGAGTNAGTYTLTASGLTSGNYAITYVSGTETIDKASLTVTVNSPRVTYGQMPTLGVSYGGFVNGDTAGSLGGHVVVSGAGTNAGTYTLTASGLTSRNYAITYVSGTETIDKASLTVTVNSPTVTYGQTPTLGVGYGGFVNGDTAASLGGQLAFSGAGTDVGTYVVTAGGLTSSNYTIAYAPGRLTITPASLVVTANSQTIQQGQTPQFGVTYNGFVNGDGPADLTGMLTYSGAGTTPGTYVVTPGGLSARNYVLTYVSGRLTIEGSQPVPPFQVPDVPSAAHFITVAEGEVAFAANSELVASGRSKGNYRIVCDFAGGTDRQIAALAASSGRSQACGADSAFTIAKSWR